MGRRRKTTPVRRRFLPSSGGGLRLESQGAVTRHAYDPEPLGAGAGQREKTALLQDSLVNFRFSF